MCSTLKTNRIKQNKLFINLTKYVRFGYFLKINWAIKQLESQPDIKAIIKHTRMEGNL